MSAEQPNRIRRVGGSGGGPSGWSHRNKVLAVIVVAALLLGGGIYFSLSSFFRSGAATVTDAQINRLDVNTSTLCTALARAGKPCPVSSLAAGLPRADEDAYRACIAETKVYPGLAARCQNPSAPPTTAPPSSAPPTTTPPTTTPTTTPPTTAPPAGYPNASNTGVPAGTTLTNYPGPWTITTANTALSGLNFTGSNRLVIRAPGVTIKNSKFTNNVDNGFLVSMDDSYPTASLTISDSEFVGAGANMDYDQMAIRGSGWSLLRVNAHNLENIGGDDGNNTIKDSYFHNWPTDNPNCDHLDGLQSLGSVDNVTIQHNSLIMDATSCIAAPIQMGTEYGYAGHNVLIDNNLLGGGAHVIYCGDGAQTNTGATVTNSNVRVTNNRFTKQIFPNYGQYSVSDHCATGSGTTWTGNVDADSGATVPPNG